MLRAILEGDRAAAPVIFNDRSYPIRVRFPEQDRSSLDRMTEHAARQRNRAAQPHSEPFQCRSDPGQTEIRRENLQRLMEVTGRLEGVDLGRGIAGVKKAVADSNLPVIDPG